MEIERKPQFFPDDSQESGGRLNLRPLGIRDQVMEFTQPDHGRTLVFSRRSGRLHGILFSNYGKADLTQLPQDAVIPNKNSLRVLFEAKGVAPQIDEVLAPHQKPREVQVLGELVPQPAF